MLIFLLILLFKGLGSASSFLKKKKEINIIVNIIQQDQKWHLKDI